MCPSRSTVLSTRRHQAYPVSVLILQSYCRRNTSSVVGVDLQLAGWFLVKMTAGRAASPKGLTTYILASQTNLVNIHLSGTRCRVLATTLHQPLAFAQLVFTAVCSYSES